MSKFMYNGKPYGGSTNYASSVTCTDAEGNESTVQVEIDKNRDDIDELNKNFEWTKVGEVNGSDAIALPSDFNEVQFVIMNGNTALVMSYRMSKAEINDIFTYAKTFNRSSMNVIINGGYSTGENSGLAYISLNNNWVVYLSHFNWGPNNIRDASKMVVYVR